MSVLELFSLAGTRALVTGASRGLGRAMAQALAEAGADVVCASSKADGAEETANDIRAIGRDAWTTHADLADRDSVLRMATDVDETAGEINILVNNGGSIARHAAERYPMDEWDRVLRTNLDAVWLLSQHFGRRMIERGAGKIINVASLLSFSGGITVPAYTASKHAVAGVTKALANEWAKHNVQINAIAPGYFSTDNTQRLRDDPQRFTEISARIPAARWGAPSDVMGAAVFLASRASNYVNGHILVVDGGWMAR
jgi:2-dehydro-3-deoxy-D-gluconate 5-dehydrogenase